MNVLHMKKGTGEASYAQNSMLQRLIISKTKHVVEEAIVKILHNADNVPDTFGVADIGCGSGSNTLLATSSIIKTVHTRCQDLGCRVPELRISLNDLPDNDFNSVFGSLPEFYKASKIEKESCLISGVPGSFYGRLFPKKSLHFVHSSTSLHWLSQVPPCLVSGGDNKPSIVNKGNVYISKTSPEGVSEAYAEQFQTDFKVFLESRSAEVVNGGRMVMSLYGRISPHPTDENALFDLFNQVLITLVAKGVVEEDKVNSVNLPMYKPCTDEMKTAIEKEGSFTIDRLESFEIGWDKLLRFYDNASDEFSSTKKLPEITKGQLTVTIVRAIFDSMLESHFGTQIVEDIFTTMAVIFDENQAKYSTKYANVVASLIRK